MALTPENRFTVMGFSLGVAPVADRHWKDSQPQDVADYFLMEWQRPKDRLILWPLAEHWATERHTPRAQQPHWMRTNNVSTYYFRTDTGTMGLLQIMDFGDQNGGTTIRFKRVQPND